MSLKPTNKGENNMTRQEANRKILNLLSATIEQHPDWRFHQILQNLDVNLRDVATLRCFDQFYEESEETFNRIEATAKSVFGIRVASK
jgi:hypothetical protein